MTEHLSVDLIKARLASLDFQLNGVYAEADQLEVKRSELQWELAKRSNG